jgi:proteic killer suppression protein
LAIPGAGLHQLPGERSGLWALAVSGNWRLTFRFEAGDLHVVDYLGYH